MDEGGPGPVQVVDGVEADREQAARARMAPASDLEWALEGGEKDDEEV